jgi:DNA-binding NarL/FixJ family response regulator
MTEGLSNKEIAAKKNIALKSCENAIARLAKKLEIPFVPETNQRVMLVRYYLKHMGKIH